MIAPGGGTPGWSGVALVAGCVAGGPVAWGPNRPG